MSLAAALVGATTVQKTTGMIIAWVTILGSIVYFLTNVRRARPEVGAETELAPNRKPYFSDEELEGPRLDRYLTYALVLLGVIAVALPLYWLAEPGRQADSTKRFEAIFASRGEALFNTNCSSCHAQGATGGVAAYVLQDKEGKFLANVTWRAPALNNALLRFDRSEVQYVLDHGRAFSPMQPWSTVGGGAMNAQQIKNLIDYLQSIKISSDKAADEIHEGLITRIVAEQQGSLTDEDQKKAVDKKVRDAFAAAKTDADALIALGLASDQRSAQLQLGARMFNLTAASGSYSCARCHTQGWSYDRPGPTGSGAFGPKLYSVIDKFNDVAQLQTFISEGCADGKLYGRQSECKSGMMPGFGEMYTKEELAAVAAYVATLNGSQQYNPNAAAGSTK